MILAGESNTACLTFMRQTWGVSRAQGYRLLKKAWQQIHEDIEGPDLDRQEMWLGASTRCWRRLVRPKRSGTLARLCLPFASSIGCAGWVLILNVGTASTGTPTEFLHFLHAEFATSPVCSAGGFR